MGCQRHRIRQARGNHLIKEEFFPILVCAYGIMIQRVNPLGNPTSKRRCSGSGSGSVKCATGHVVADGQASHGKWATGPNINQLRLRKDKINIGTWNVRGLLQAGKLSLLEKELLRQKIDICGISETHWKD